MSAPFKLKEWPGWMKKIGKKIKKYNITGSPYYNPDGTLKPNPFPEGGKWHERWEADFGKKKK